MCTKTKSKALLITFNFLFWAAGSVMLGLGVWMKVDPDAVITYVRLMILVEVDSDPPLVSHAAILFIVIGACAFFVGFIGLCGAYNEKTPMLVFYSFLLGIFMVAEISAVVLLIVYLHKVDESLQDKHLKKAFANENLFKDATKTVWNHIQAGLKCCGIIGFRDYRKLSWWSAIKGSMNLSDAFVPESCCVRLVDEGHALRSEDPPPPNTQCQLDAKMNVSISDHLYVEGCKAAVYDWIYRHTVAMVTIAAGIFAFELIGAIAATCLWLIIRRSAAAAADEK